MRPALYFIAAIIAAAPPLKGQENFDRNEGAWDSGTDILTVAQQVYSFRTWDQTMLAGTELMLCPAGMKRVSPNDVRKRRTFDWVSEYNNIYLRLPCGLVVEGMNDEGFSASLMFLESGLLPGEDRIHIPIAATLCVNFFIDHFNCVDTALLAIWDIRIFDDPGSGCGWPFRIILHDSTGATAFFEYTDGHKRVYTPDPPVLIVGGPEYARLLTLRHISDSLASGRAEERFMELDRMMQGRLLNHASIPEALSDQNDGRQDVLIERNHSAASMTITLDTATLTFVLNKMDFTPGSETSAEIF